MTCRNSSRLEIRRSRKAIGSSNPSLPIQPSQRFLARFYILACPERIDSLNCGLVKFSAASKAA